MSRYERNEKINNNQLLVREYNERLHKYCPIKFNLLFSSQSISDVCVHTTSFFVTWSLL